MDSVKICASPFWNESISWNTPDPYFSECFKHLILVIGSCAVLWLVAPFEFIKICRYRGSPHPWTTLSVSKMVCKVLLLIICIIELIKEVYAYVTSVKAGLDGLIAAIAYFLTIVLTVILTMMCKKRGLRSSMALPSFWMISTITTVITIYDDIHGVDQSSWVSLISLLDDCAVFVISLVQLILSNITEKGASPYGRQLMNYCPLDGCSMVSRLTFSWIYGLLTSSTRNALHTDDLIPLCTEFRSMVVAERFSEIWNGGVREVSNSSQIPTEQEESSEVLFQQHGEIQINRDRRKQGSLLESLFKISSLYLLISSFFEILYTTLYFLPVYILSLILKNTEEPKWHIYLYATVLFITILLTTLVDSQRKYYGLASAFKIKTAVMNAIFEKAFVSQQSQNAEKLLEKDAENIFQMMCLLTDVWGTSIRIFLGLYLLWSFMGSACFVGMGTAALLIPLTILIGNRAHYYKSKALDAKSDWLGVLSECLHGMRSLKFYAWEEFFLQKIKAVRESEINKLKRTKLLRISFKILLLCSTSLVSLAAFYVFVIMTDLFDLKIIFLSYFTIWLLKSPFTNVLRLLAHFVEGLSSISQIENFLKTKEIENLSKPNANSEYKIFLENAAFGWANNKECNLKNLTLNSKDGSLIAVVGKELSGKSSLLRALMGEIEKFEGTAFVKGEIAFVSDDSWIQNATLEENILFGRQKSDAIYSELLEACDLQQDVESLPLGDETQIGEKGYPLSHVQKLKVDLARAAYQNADIYLIDDVFKCTDNSTAEQLFEKVLSHRGVLKKKIRFFTTNSATYLLPFVDHIILLEDGEILEQGNYYELVKKCGKFSEYLQNESPSKILEKKYRCNVSEKKDISLGNFKYHCDLWHSATGLSFSPEMDSFMQGEIMTAPKALFRKVLNYIKMNGYIVTITAIITAILANLCEVMSLTWWAWNTSEHEGDRKMHRDLYIYAGFVLSQVTFCFIGGLIISWGNTKAIGNFYNWLIGRIMKAPLTTYGTVFVGRTLQSFDKDLQFADEEIPVGIFVWLVTLMKAPVLLVIIFVNCPFLCLLFLYVIGFLYIIQRLYMNAWRQLHYLSTSTRCPLFNLSQNVFQGISNVRTSKTNIHFLSRFHFKLDSYNKCNFLFLLVSRWLSSSIEILGSVFILFVALTVIYIKGQGSYFTALLIVFSMQLSECLVSAVYLSSMLDIDLSCLERFVSFSNVKQETEFDNPTARWMKSGAITTRNLSTIYGEGFYPVLNNISITVRPGEKVGIIGKEDSGISTILDSLFRLREITEGQIFIDNVDICHIALSDLRSKLAIIPQDPLIFNGTLRENLDPERRYVDEELQLAIKTAELDSNFSDLNTIIGSHNISVEEKYHIALARCLLKMSRIVVVENSEKSRSTEKYFPNSTLLSFGNKRLLENYDRIISISSGEIVEVMPHHV